ncbi:MAG: glutamate-5-semialdehyde dehydrogenase [Clostridia bacterium]|nr:glutamate-5-semialdehyde dehydrogenase [Clostridia bacterium]
MTTIETMGKKAKEVARILATAGALKDKALISIADALIENTDYILEENAKDLEAGKAAGLTNALLDRLALSPERIKGMADGARQVAALADPCGRVISGGKLKNGLEVTKVTVPLGVIGIIYEARPNVTADSAVLCLKSGNAVILRGGKEAINSNKAVATVMRKAIEIAGLPADCVQLIEDTTRQSSIELMGLSDYLDVLIPRGGAGLIKATVENAKVPVIETGVGNCHVYVDEYADPDMAAEIIYNAKTSRPSVCNAIETILVHKNIADKALPLIKAKLDEKNVELRGCEKTVEILGDSVKPACDEDYATEFLDYILAVKVVNCINCALNHIAKYSSGHSECIVTENYTNAEKFLNTVDAAAVYVNASTRFTDGGEFGLGAEIGISTQKLHARGPMGINELTSMKFIVKGNGQVR